MEELAKYLKAILAMSMRQDVEDDAREKPELLLSRLGFTNGEIAELIDKSEGAVRKAVWRANNPKKAKGT